MKSLALLAAITLLSTSAFARNTPVQAATLAEIKTQAQSQTCTKAPAQTPFTKLFTQLGKLGKLSFGNHVTVAPQYSKRMCSISVTINY